MGQGIKKEMGRGYPLDNCAKAVCSLGLFVKPDNSVLFHIYWVEFKSIIQGLCDLG